MQSALTPHHLASSPIEEQFSTSFGGCRKRGMEGRRGKQHTSLLSPHILLKKIIRESSGISMRWERRLGGEGGLFDGRRG